jgi:cytochrome b6-f complex iron-sulfur subunit
MTMSCESCVNRREFLIRAAGTSGAAALLAACGDGQISNPTVVRVPDGGVPGGGSTKIVVDVSSIPQLATVGVLVQVPSAFIAAKRTGAATFDAFSMACTHEGFLVNITNGQRFDCPAHGSRFANDGSVLLGPATRALQKLPTSYDPATDQLTIG